MARLGTIVSGEIRPAPGVAWHMTLLTEVVWASVALGAYRQTRSLMAAMLLVMIKVANRLSI